MMEELQKRKEEQLQEAARREVSVPFPLLPHFTAPSEEGWRNISAIVPFQLQAFLVPGYPTGLHNFSSPAKKKVNDAQ